MGIVSDIEKTLQIPRLGTALLAILLGALLLMIPWLLNYLIAVGLIIWNLGGGQGEQYVEKFYPDEVGLNTAKVRR